MVESPSAISIIALFWSDSLSHAALFISNSLTETCWCQPGK